MYSFEPLSNNNNKILCGCPCSFYVEFVLLVSWTFSRRPKTCRSGELEPLNFLYCTCECECEWLSDYVLWTVIDTYFTLLLHRVQYVQYVFYTSFLPQPPAEKKEVCQRPQRIPLKLIRGDFVENCLDEELTGISLTSALFATDLLEYKIVSES